MVRRSRMKKRAALVAAKGGACELCGYCRHIGALEFHHKNPREKKFAISLVNTGKTMAVLLAEADKCALLCANCHREVHAGVAHLEEQTTDNRQV